MEETSSLINGVEGVANAVNSLKDGARTPIKDFPEMILTAALPFRPGLSTIVSTANIIEKLNKLGFPTSLNEDGSDNMTNKLVSVIVEEIYRAIMNDMKIQSVTQPMSMFITGTGANAGGPVQIIGSNTTCGTSYGIAH